MLGTDAKRKHRIMTAADSRRRLRIAVGGELLHDDCDLHRGY